MIAPLEAAQNGTIKVVAVPTKIMRSRADRMNLSATFDGFVPAANPNA